MTWCATASYGLFVWVVVSQVTMMNTEDSKPPSPAEFLGTPLLQTDLHPANIISEVWSFIRGIPPAVDRGFAGIEHAVARPFEVVGHALNSVRPDKLLRRLLHPPFSWKCRRAASRFSCMFCVNITVPFSDNRERICKNVTIDPLNLSVGLNEIVNDKSFINLVLTVPILGGNAKRFRPAKTSSTTASSTGPVVFQESTTTSSTKGNSAPSSTTSEPEN